MNTTDQLASVEMFLQQVGLKEFRNLNQFWAYIDGKYPTNITSDLEMAYVKLDQGEEDSFYERIFMDLETSLDFASIRRNLYSSFLSWLTKDLETKSPPKVIVDIGCGNGIISCFLAKTFPESKIIGQDLNANAIACARELATKLELSNTEFIEGDANSLSLPVEPASIDLIFSVASLGPQEQDLVSIIGKPLANVTTFVNDLKGSASPAMIAKYLEAGTGRYISFDKIPSIESQLLWCSNLQNAGLSVDLKMSSWLTYLNIDQDEVTLPVLSTRLSDDRTDSNNLLAFFLKKPGTDIRWSLEFGQEALAESIFTYVNPRRFILGGRAEFSDGSGTYWYELWQAGPFLIEFEHTDKGFRCLQARPAHEQEEAKAKFEEWKEQSSNYATVSEIPEPERQFRPAE